MKFTLQAENDPEDKNRVIEHRFDSNYLPDVLEELQSFLRAAGFCFDGELTIEEPVDLEQNR